MTRKRISRHDSRYDRIVFNGLKYLKNLEEEINKITIGYIQQPILL